MTQLPVELIINIYNFCNIPTRININRSFNWSYKYINPYKDITFKTYYDSYAYGVYMCHNGVDRYGIFIDIFKAYLFSQWELSDGKKFNKKVYQQAKNKCLK